MRIAIGSMVNAYEQWKTNPDEAQREFYKDIVLNPHSLSEALQKKAGCCRYQGALFFVLGYEADLGDIHFIQQAPVDPKEFEHYSEVRIARGGQRSVFNDIMDFQNKRIYHVSIFKESLQDPSLDYSRSNPKVFESAIGFGWPKENKSPLIDNWKMRHYSYHKTDSGLVIVSEDSKHVKEYPV
ncbi:MAG: hypothetical protein ISS82_00845 [Nanoarchaeota archaeon]|nr:hypothetical protein [Nanoarchaeota archaeon]